MHSGVNKKRVPRTTPAAPIVSKDAIWAPVVIPPAATMGGPLGMARSTACSNVKSGGELEVPWPPLSGPTESYVEWVIPWIMISINQNTVHTSERRALHHYGINLPFSRGTPSFLHWIHDHENESLMWTFCIVRANLGDIFSEISSKCEPNNARHLLEDGW